MTMATKSHEGKCGLYHLCEQESIKYTHLEKMDCVVAIFNQTYNLKTCVYDIIRGPSSEMSMGSLLSSHF